jgi:amino acid transporter
MSNTTADNGASSYSGTVIAVNAVISVVVALGLIWVVNGFDIFYERLDRVSPTVEGGGIGTAFAQGNEIGWLVFMVEAIHAVDVLMGIFILVLVFIHWGAFRRLANRMRQPGESRVATDGGSSTADADNGGDGQ